MNSNKEIIIEKLDACEKLLVGIGEEWAVQKDPKVQSLYEKMAVLFKDKDYFIVTAVTDGEIFKSSINPKRITAPCGNVTWRQCSKACTKDIWEPGEIPDDTCPHCGAPLTGNTIEAETYIEEGYLPQWQAYTRWLSGTLNKNLLILELGAGFKTPTVIRWPFEKTAVVNNKAYMYRVNEKFFQLSEGMGKKAESAAMNSVEFFCDL